MQTISDMQRKPSRATTKLTLSKDEWNTKEDNSKTMKSTAFELHLCEVLVSQSVTHSAENSIKRFFFKFCNNFLKVFWVNHKAFLVLVLPNQYCPIIIWEIEAGF